MDYYGYTFRRLRVRKNLTLEYVSKGITSVSFLSKFERGDSDISISNIIGLLDRLNVTLSEFLFIHNGYQKKGFQQLLTLVKESYVKKNIKMLKKLMSDEINIYIKTGEIKHRINSYMIEAIILDLQKEEMNSDKIQFITEYLWTTELWSEYELTVYGNMIGVFKIETVILLSNEVFNKSDIYKGMVRIRNDMYGIFLNTIQLCIEKSRFKNAEYFIEKMKKSNIPEQFIFERLLLQLFEGVLLYKQGKKEGLELSRKSIQTLEEVGAENYFLIYSEYLNQIQNG